jgi:hypothetical protein
MKNKDESIPASSLANSFSILYDFPAERPIFWGPGQLTNYPNSYSPPDVSLWRDQEYLQIPKVVRVFSGDDGRGTDPCAPPPGPDVIRYRLMEKRDHVEPYPHDFVLVWDRYRNGVRQYTPSLYSTPVGMYALVGGNLVFVNTTSQWIIGMEFSFTAPDGLPIDYIIDGNQGTGYYTRSLGHLVTPV